jgi:hypothetical protein
MDLSEFHKILSHKFSSSCLQEEEKGEEMLRYGIVGLHTCGDLGRRFHVVGLGKKSVFRIRIRIGFETGFVFGIRIQEGKHDPQK